MGPLRPDLREHPEIFDAQIRAHVMRLAQHLAVMVVHWHKATECTFFKTCVCYLKLVCKTYIAEKSAKNTEGKTVGSP